MKGAVCETECSFCVRPKLDQRQSEKDKKYGSVEHSEITPPELTIKTATVPEMGRGVFAKCKIDKGTVIGNYEGPLIHEDDLTPEMEENNMYLWDLHGFWNGFIIDAGDPRFSNFARYVNHNKLCMRNVKAVGHAPGKTPVVSFVAICDIEKDKELFVDYGKHYNARLRGMGFEATTDAV